MTVAKMLPLKGKRMGVRVVLARECSEARSEEQAERAGLYELRREHAHLEVHERAPSSTTWF